jgi:hypothetical protein
MTDEEHEKAFIESVRRNLRRVRQGKKPLGMKYGQVRVTIQKVSPVNTKKSKHINTLGVSG